MLHKIVKTNTYLQLFINELYFVAEGFKGHKLIISL